MPEPVVSAKLTVKPDEAVAPRSKAASPYVFEVRAPKVMVCPVVTTKVTETGSARSKYVEELDCVAVMVQLPTVFKVMVAPDETAHTDVVDEE